MTVYCALLRLYPRDHRLWFGEEMQGVFERAAVEKRGRGRVAYARFLAAEYAALVGGASIAWTAKLTGRGYVHDPSLIRPVAREPLPPEVQQAQDRVDANLNGLVHAIAHHRFVKARAYAAEEQKARQELQWLREKYRIAE